MLGNHCSNTYLEECAGAFVLNEVLDNGQTTLPLQ